MSEHAKTKVPTDADLKGNPGIGTSKGLGAVGADVEDIQADSTIEGDVANEATREGGVDPKHMGRTNK
jgi:hypothetical protein